MSDSELLLLTAKFSLEETDTTPRGGIWVDASSRLHHAPTPSTVTENEIEVEPEIPTVEETEVDEWGSDAASVSDVESIASELSAQKTDVTTDHRNDHLHLTPMEQSANGVALLKHKVGIRNVPKGFTSWITVEGGDPLEAPPVLHTSLHLEVGDLFLQFHVLTVYPLHHTVRVWILVEGKAAHSGKFWKKCTGHPITHPLYNDRSLGFIKTNPTTPTWLQGASLNRLMNQPTLIA